MKRLYAALVILIIIYIGINAAFGNLNIFEINDGGSLAETLGDVKFADLKSFDVKKLNNSAVSLIDTGKNMTIKAFEIDNSKNITKIASDAYSTGYTSNQTINHNGVPVYLLFNEKNSSYDSNVYFSKNNQNYLIKSNNVTYENGDYFVETVQSIVDSVNGSGNANGDGLNLR